MVQLLNVHITYIVTGPQYNCLNYQCIYTYYIYFLFHDPPHSRPPPPPPHTHTVGPPLSSQQEVN